MHRRAQLAHVDELLQRAHGNEAVDGDIPLLADAVGAILCARSAYPHGVPVCQGQHDEELHAALGCMHTGLPIRHAGHANTSQEDTCTTRKNAACTARKDACATDCRGRHLRLQVCARVPVRVLSGMRHFRHSGLSTLQCRGDGSHARCLQGAAWITAEQGGARTACKQAFLDTGMHAA